MYGITNTNSGDVNMSTAPIAALFGHDSTNTAWITPYSNSRASWDRNYFSLSEGLFTTKKKCSVTIAVCIHAFYNSSTGSSNTGYYRILINGSEVKSGSGVATASYNTTLNVGDTVRVQCHGTTNAYISCGVGIYFRT